MQEMQELKEIIENGRINLLPAERVAENILAAGYQKPFTSDIARVTQKAYKEVYEKAQKNAVKEFAERVKLKTIVDNRLCVREYDIGYNDGYSEAYYSFHKIIDELFKEYEK